jgi:hypothetical protein
LCFAENARHASSKWLCVETLKSNMLNTSRYPNMDASSLHCDFAASSGFDSESNHVDFDKSV